MAPAASPDPLRRKSAVAGTVAANAFERRAQLATAKFVEALDIVNALLREGNSVPRASASAAEGGPVSNEFFSRDKPHKRSVTTSR